MRADSIVFAVAGVLFGVIVGWVLGSQQATEHGAGRGARGAGPGGRGAGGARRAVRPCRSIRSACARSRAWPSRTRRTRSRACSSATCSSTPSSIPRPSRWYEQALALNPKDPNVSTDLGVAYYYTNQPDRAIQQFEHSLVARSQAHQDAAEHGHRPRVRQAGPRRRPPRRGSRWSRSRRTRPKGRRRRRGSKACRTRIRRVPTGGK